MASIPLIIRALERQEFEAAATLVQAAWPEKEQAFRAELGDMWRDDEVVLLGAFDSAATPVLAGIGLLSPHQLDFYTWVLSWGAVLPNYQRHGIATVLAQALCAKAETLQAHRRQRDSSLDDECIITVSTVVPSLFEKLGFQSTLKFGRDNRRHHMVKCVPSAGAAIHSHR